MNFVSPNEPAQDHRTTPVNPAAPITISGNVVPLVEPPLVSIVLINWNYARYIGQTIDSIISQDYQKFECIIVDNGSEDESLEVIKHHIGSDTRFKIIPLPSNLGMLGGVFIGLKEAQGSFLAVVDSDDVLFKNFISSHLQAHLSAPENVAITTSNIIEVDGKGRALTSQYNALNQTKSQGVAGLRPKEATARLSVISDRDYANLDAASRTLDPSLQGWLWAPGTSNMLRASTLRHFIRSDGVQYMRGADNYLLPFCHSLGGTLVIDLALSAYRIHETNYNTAMESVWSVTTGNQVIRTLYDSHYLQNVEFLLADPVPHLDRLGHRYWKAFTQVGLGAFNPRNKSCYELFLKYAKPLKQATGDNDFLRNIMARFSFSQTIQILFAANESRIPTRLFFKAITLKLRRRKLRSLQREARS